MTVLFGMMDFLFSLCIAPIEGVMRNVLQGAFAVTDSWGAALVLLSLAVNAALLPIYHVAETWQEAERAAQRRMAPRLAEIREVFSGRERYYYTRALYRLHGYSPLYALRAVAGLLVQILFFIAAYHLLNAAPEFSGVSWRALADLSRPDALIPIAGWRGNLLPVVMTAANLASAAVYASRLTRREKIQLYGLAALFLFLLYQSSSALLIYWTCNNLFSLGKNIFYVRVVYKEPSTPHPVERPEAPGGPSFLTWKAGGLDLFLTVTGGAAHITAAALRKSRVEILPLDLILIGASVLLAGLALLFRLIYLRRVVGLSDNGLTRPCLALPVLAALIASFCLLKLNYSRISMNSVYIGLFAGYLFSRGPLWNLGLRLAALAEARLPGGNSGALFQGASLTLALLVCWYTPAILYASDPAYFGEPFSALLGGLGFRALLFLAACWVIHRLSPPRFRPLLAVIWAWAAVSALLFTFVAAGDYGILRDDLRFQNPELLESRPLACLVDAAVALTSAGLIYLGLRLGRDKAGVLAQPLQVAALAIVLIVVWLGFTAPPNPAADTSIDNPSTDLPGYNDELFSFSRQGQNTLVFMTDMFTGSHLEPILEASPELRQELDGFVWYRDAIATGANTLLSIGGILGGEYYSPPNINVRKVDSLESELNRAFTALPAIFTPRGYHVALADVAYLSIPLFKELCVSCVAPQTLVAQGLGNAYTGYWRKLRKNLGLPALPLIKWKVPLLVNVGLFRAAPWLSRPKIYNDGVWLDRLSVVRDRLFSEGHYALLDSLPEISNAGSGNSTVKFILSNLTHYPWMLDEATCLPTAARGSWSWTIEKNGAVREHLATERCALLALGRFFTWMKREGIYDNSQIIIVSDHDTPDSLIFRGAYGFEKDIAADSLLLVKQRGGRGELKTDWSPMSSSDVLPLICAADGPCSLSYPGITEGGGQRCESEPTALEAPAVTATRRTAL